MPGKITLFFVLFLAASLRMFAVDLGEWHIDPIVRFWGLGLYAEFSGWELFRGRDTRLVGAFDGAYESTAFFRNVDGTGYVPPTQGITLAAGEAEYRRLNLNWTLGIRQGMTRGKAAGASSLYILCLYRGRFDSNIDNGSLLFQSTLSDASAILQNSLISGLGVDLVERDPATGTRRGFFFEGTIELAPGFLLNEILPGAGYSRVNAELQGFAAARRIPLFGSEASLEIGSRIVADRLSGGGIPVNARQSIGGSRYEIASGGILRGIHKGRFDGIVKIISNTDARFNLPAVGFLIPAILLYTDMGLTDDLTGILNLERFLLSAGAGIALNLFDTDFNVRLDYFLNERLPSLSVTAGSHY